ncbi:MAG: hypothetical protein H7301_10190 [Cryobacterium sp.]|nr:hypothetical protein [Oligoflexia bacterium]
MGSVFTHRNLSKLSRLGVTGCLWLLATTSLSFAAELKNLVTYSQFETLLKLKSSELTELKPLWDKQRFDPRWRRIYLSGGTLRGLAHWVHESLQTHSYDEFVNLPVPSIANLLRITWSDRDLVVPDDQAPLVASLLGGGWDVLSESFQLESTLAGGPGLDKSRVNPYELVDPLHGMVDFYEGKLTFHQPSGMVSGRLLTGNSQTAMALRFLREAIDLPELVPDAESMEQIRAIGRREVLPTNNYWLEKALHKLFLATHENLATAVLSIRNAGLLNSIVASGYSFKVVQKHEFTSRREEEAALSARTLISAGLSSIELQQAEAIAGFKTQEARNQFRSQILVVQAADVGKPKLLEFLKNFSNAKLDFSEWMIVLDSLPESVISVSSVRKLVSAARSSWLSEEICTALIPIGILDEGLRSLSTSRQEMNLEFSTELFRYYGEALNHLALVGGSEKVQALLANWTHERIQTLSVERQEAYFQSLMTALNLSKPQSAKISITPEASRVMKFRLGLSSLFAVNGAIGGFAWTHGFDEFGKLWVGMATLLTYAVWKDFIQFDWKFLRPAYQKQIEKFRLGRTGGRARDQFMDQLHKIAERNRPECHDLLKN